MTDDDKISSGKLTLMLARFAVYQQKMYNQQMICLTNSALRRRKVKEVPQCAFRLSKHPLASTQLQMCQLILN